MTMQSWVSSYLSDADVKEIEGAIARAEAKTSGEIVPMIVRRSVSLRATPFIAMLSMMSLLFVAALFFHFDFSTTRHLMWLLGGVALSLLVAFAASRIEPLQKFFTLDGDEADAAFARAQLEFFQTGIPVTEGRTGVLIFISLFERRAFVLGDKAITDRMRPEAWVEITQEMVGRLHTGHFKAGLVGAIEAVGAKLAQEFPRASNDGNELADHLIIKD